MHLIARGAAALLLSLSLFAPASASAEDFVWAIEDATATRWIEKDSSSVGAVSVAQKLEVLFEEGDRIRVRLQGAAFGWLDVSAVARVEPAAEAETEEGADETETP